MKHVYSLAAFLTTFLTAGHSMAQVQLPLEASNCAIFNALNPDSTYYCAQISNLGEARGLIVRMDPVLPTPDGQQTVLAQLPEQGGDITAIKPVKSPRINHRAAKSESGYYIHFAFDSEALEKQYRDHLDRLAIVLNSDAMKDNCVKITGHTDTVGSAQYNMDLSRRRAKSVYDYLAAIDNIGKKRFTIAAEGETQPLPEKNGISPYNRRVEFLSRTVANGCLPQS